MATFKFNFSQSTDETVQTQAHQAANQTNNNEHKEPSVAAVKYEITEQQVASAMELSIENESIGIPTPKNRRGEDCAEYAINLYKTNLSGTNTLGGITVHSDVVPSVYEGGFKLWECAADIIYFLEDHNDKYNLKDARLLDLGCGHALPGLYSLFFPKAAYVALQDYNADVITNCTIPNAIHNTLRWKCNSKEQLSQQYQQTIEFLNSRCGFYSGDWSDEKLVALLTHNNSLKYDIILSSDTIYSQQSIKPLVKIIKSTLAENGVALIAAKRFYFGVGGSTKELLEVIQAEGALTARVMETFEDGKSNVREIIEVKRSK
jgi:predicted nicotinamide N-methyase